MNPTITTEKILRNSTMPEFPSAMLERQPIAGAQSYYRSRIFTTQIDINPIIAAAEPLLAINNKLKLIVHNTEIEQLQLIIKHEINAFETNAQNRGYRAETILIARYILCASLDETLEYTAWGQACKWSNQPLVHTYQREESASERFFLILERLCEEPKQHIDLLELIYLCLSLGFEGKYRQQAKGKIELDKIIDNLSQLIQQLRHEPQALFQPDIKPNADPLQSQLSLKSFLIKTTLVTLVLMLLIYIGFAYLFDLVTAPVQFQIHRLAQVSTSLSKESL